MRTSSICIPIGAIAGWRDIVRRGLAALYGGIAMPVVLECVRRGAEGEPGSFRDELPDLARLVVLTLDAGAAPVLRRLRSELLDECHRKASLHWTPGRYVSCFLGTFFAELVTQKARIFQLAQNNES